MADFSHLPTRAKFVAFMPQWDFLDFLADHAKRLPTFRLMQNTEATDLLRDADRVTGVTAHGPDGVQQIGAELSREAGRSCFGFYLAGPIVQLILRLGRVRRIKTGLLH